MLACSGGLYGGSTFYVVGNRMAYEYKAYNEDPFQIKSDRPLPAGDAELTAENYAQASHNSFYQKPPAVYGFRHGVAEAEAGLYAQDETQPTLSNRWDHHPQAP